MAARFPLGAPAVTAVGLVCTAEHGFLWADTQVFVHGEPAWHAPKLVVNVAGRLAAAGSGPTTMMQEADEIAAQAADIHELAAALPTALREHKGNSSAHRRAACTALYLASGWSPRWRRVAAFSLAAPWFEPRVVQCLAAPHVADLASLHPESADDLRATVADQIFGLEREFNCRIGGKVACATVTAGGVAARVIFGPADASPATPDARAAALA